jgi:hypothetical protein
VGTCPGIPTARSCTPGGLGDSVSIEHGYAAARLTGLNCLAGIRLALGSLDRVAAIVRSLNFVVCTPEFFDVHRVSSGATDLLLEVFGEEPDSAEGRRSECSASRGETASRTG